MILWLFLGLVAFTLYATKNILFSVLRPRLSPSPLQILKGPNKGKLLYGHTYAYKTPSPQPERWIERVFEKFGYVTVLRGQFNVRNLSSVHFLFPTSSHRQA